MEVTIVAGDENGKGQWGHGITRGHMCANFVLGAMMVLLLPFSVVSKEAKKEEVPNELPRSWKMEEIDKATVWSGSPGLFYVLAWSITYDANRDFRVETCLVMRIRDDGRCVLAHLYRHPGSKDPAWKESMSHARGGDAGKTGRWYFHFRVFEKTPGNKEVYDSFSFTGVNWSFDQDESFQFVGCGVCEESWRRAIGEKPTRFFGKADKK